MTRGLLIALVTAAALRGEWLRFTSPNFELFTDTGDPKGRHMLERLERIREVFRESAGGHGTPLPVRIFVFGSGRDWNEVRPNEHTHGFYQGGPERDNIALADGPETARAAFHEYIHLVLNHTSVSLPKWLEEGTAEFYSTLQTKGEQILLGLPIPHHAARLMNEQWLDAQALMQGNDAGHAGDPRRIGLFYAQSWALAHMLNLGPGYRRLLPRFLELLSEGVPPPIAFEQAFSKPLDAALRDLRGYVKQGRYPVATVHGGKFEPAAIESARMAPEHSELVRVELLLECGLEQAAMRRLARLEKQAPNSPEVLTALGLQAIGAKQPDRARQYLERALTAGSRQALTHFEYAMLLRDTGGDPVLVRRHLSEAVGRNPRLAEAQFLLGLEAQKENRHADAITPLEEAARILPRQSYFWHALAISYHRTGRLDQARRAARRAAESAATQQQLEMAQAAIRLVGAEFRAAAPPPARPSVVVPKSWEPRQGEGRAEGILEHIDCLGAAARFSVRTPERVVRLWVDKPGEVLLKTASAITFDFACGAQQPRRVSIEFVPKPDTARKTEGEITAIEFP